jgi:hypothetical protein
MAGNVWEMTSSPFDTECKAMRGGCYITYLYFCRTTIRWRPSLEELRDGAPWLGFRCARSV